MRKITVFLIVMLASATLAMSQDMMRCIYDSKVILVDSGASAQLYNAPGLISGYHAADTVSANKFISVCCENWSNLVCCDSGTVLPYYYYVEVVKSDSMAVGKSDSLDIIMKVQPLTNGGQRDTSWWDTWTTCISKLSTQRYMRVSSAVYMPVLPHGTYWILLRNAYATPQHVRFKIWLITKKTNCGS